MWAAFWGKSKELAASLVANGALEDPTDMFFLRRTEVEELIFDTVAAWSTGVAGRGPCLLGAYHRPAPRNVCSTGRVGARAGARTAAAGGRRAADHHVVGDYHRFGRKVA